MKLYSTLLKLGEDEQTIEKSRFIVHAMPVETREEADEFIASIRKKYKDATHNVPAMVLGDKMQLQWGSDDGEPQGTSGAPIVQMMVKEGITNAVVVVTRYFGGIKLGTGGLVRAYTSSAKLGLEAAGIADILEMSILKYRVSYSVYNRITTFAFPFDMRIEDEEYSDSVTFKIVTDPDNTESLKEIIVGLSNGAALPVSEEIGKKPVPRETHSVED